MRKDIDCGDFIGSVYAGCVDYEVRRREGWEWLGVGDADCILLYMICFELGLESEGMD